MLSIACVGPGSKPLALRFAWSSLKYHEQMGREIMEQNLQLPDLDDKIALVDRSERVREMYDLRENDAMQTLMEWLYGRLQTGL